MNLNMHGTLATSPEVHVIPNNQIGNESSHIRYPLSVYLASSDANRNIEFSIDGTTFFAPTGLISSADNVCAIATFQISAVRFTGAANDTWGVL